MTAVLIRDYLRVCYTLNIRKEIYRYDICLKAVRTFRSGWCLWRLRSKFYLVKLENMRSQLLNIYSNLCDYNCIFFCSAFLKHTLDIKCRTALRYVVSLQSTGNKCNKIRSTVAPSACSAVTSLRTIVTCNYSNLKEAWVSRLTKRLACSTKAHQINW